MKKIGKLLLPAALGLALCFSGCGKKGTGTAKAVTSAGVLKVAVYGVSEQEEQTDRISAATLKEARYIAQLLSVQTEFIPAESPDAAADMLNAGAADLAAGRLLSRASEPGHVLRTSTVAEESACVVTKRGDYSDSLAAFSDRTAGVSDSLSSLGFSLGDRVNQVSFSESEVASALESGKIEGWFCTEQEAKKLVREDSNLQVQSAAGAELLSYCMYVKEGDNAFLTPVNQAIAKGIPAEDKSGEKK